MYLRGHQAGHQRVSRKCGWFNLIALMESYLRPLSLESGLIIHSTICGAGYKGKGHRGKQISVEDRQWPYQGSNPVPPLRDQTLYCPSGTKLYASPSLEILHLLSGDVPPLRSMKLGRSLLLCVQ